MSISTQHSLALLFRKGLGDGLIYHIIAHNLQANGFKVTFFNSPLSQLSRWFPDHTIDKRPQPHELDSTLAAYDWIITDDDSIVSHIPQSLTNKLLYIDKKHYIQPGLTMVDNMPYLLKHIVNIDQPSLHNGITPPTQLKAQCYPQQIIIHPTSTDPKKNWPAKKFIKLAHLLKQHNYQPIFCVSPQERPSWEQYLPTTFDLPEFHSVDDLATTVYQAGLFIGNDSGTGHLASCLGLPTFTLTRLPTGRSQLWRPGWGNNHLMTPPGIWGNTLRKHYWQYLLNVGRVYRTIIRS